MRQRHLVDERRVLDDMGRRVDVGGVVHAGRDALRQHAGLRHVVDALDLDVFEIGPVRRLKAEAVGEVVELQPHRVVEVALELDAADLHRHVVSSGLALPPKQRVARRFLLYRDTMHMYRDTVKWFHRILFSRPRGLCLAQPTSAKGEG